MLLHVPLGITYFKVLKAEGPISRKDLGLGIVYNAIFALVGVGSPNFIGRDRNSRHVFRPDQVGTYAVRTDA